MVGRPVVPAVLGVLDQLVVVPLGGPGVGLVLEERVDPVVAVVAWWGAVLPSWVARVASVVARIRSRASNRGRLCSFRDASRQDAEISRDASLRFSFRHRLRFSIACLATTGSSATSCGRAKPTTSRHDRHR